MSKLNDDELRDLIAETTPDAILDDDMERTPRNPPSSARPVVDRAELARKVAAQRHGLDSDADFDGLAPPEPLYTDESKFIGQSMRSPDGMPTVKTAVVSTETGERIAEQG